MTAPKTLRQSAGLLQPEQISSAKTALILIDIQNDYFNPAALPIPQGPRVVQQSTALLDWADENSVLVIHVQHVSPNPKSPLFAIGSHGAEIHPGVSPRPEHRLVSKTMPSSFTGTGLNEILRKQNIETLILGGMMTHMCVDSTARHALHLGYKVIIAADACATRDWRSPTGDIMPADTIHAVSLAALADRFADVITTKEICSLPIM